MTTLLRGGVALCALLLASPSLATPPVPVGASCGMDECHLPARLHAVAVPAAEAPSEAALSRWTWLRHDLALARDAARSGQPSLALDRVVDADLALRTRVGEARATLGPAYVEAMHGALQDVATGLRSWPLAPLDPAAPAQGLVAR